MTSQLHTLLITIIPSIFNQTPVFTISFMTIFSVPKTNVLGGVATGSIKAKEAAMVNGIKK